jgi:hypothetical protein
MEGTIRVRRTSIRWLDSAEQGLKNLQIRNWKKKALERDQWRGTLEAVKACNRL